MKQFDTTKKSYKIPENYFDQLENSILRETKKFSHDICYDVPTDFFDMQQKSIFSKTIDKKSIRTKRLLISVSGIAACILVGVALLNISKEINLTINQNLSVLHGNKVDVKTEEAVYKSLYQSYFIEDDQKKSSNELTLDDFEDYYNNEELSGVY